MNRFPLKMKEQIDNMKNSHLRSMLEKVEIRDRVLAMVDSLRKMQNAQLTPEQKRELLHNRRLETEKNLKTDFEEGLKRKYLFQFVWQNFPSALEVARKMKQEQNQLREAKKAD